MKQIKTKNVFVQGVRSILNILKNKLVMMEILVFPKWMVEFHVHANVSIISWRAIHAQPREPILFHKFYFRVNPRTWVTLFGKRILPKTKKHTSVEGFINPRPRFYKALDRVIFQPSVEVFINPRSRY